METLGMCQRHPTKKIAHPSILERLKNKMPVVRKELVAQDATRIASETFSEYSLERFKVGCFLEHLCPSLATVQCMVNPICLIGTFWS
jgi:hypothetical protein